MPGAIPHLRSAPATCTRRGKPSSSAATEHRHCEEPQRGDDAIQESVHRPLDCFVELVIGPDTSGRTRWLAMTPAWKSWAVLTRLEAGSAGGLDRRPTAAVGVVGHAQAVEERQPEKTADRKHPFQRRRALQAHEKNKERAGLQCRDAELHYRRPIPHAEKRRQ